MNLSELTDNVLGLVGESDDAAREACARFLNKRYKYIYNSFPWAESEMTATLSIVRDEDKFEFPRLMERVIAIRANGNFLDPVTSNELLQTDPGIFERYGDPTSYQEILDDDGIRKIQVFPLPDKTTELLIVGKRALVTLVEENDEPILRNIDTVLIAYAEGDMYERQRQNGKAQEKFKEAAALMVSVQQLETEQTNRPRQIKQLTVAGNSLAELTDAVSARTDKWALSDRVFIKDCLRRQYQRLYDSNLWPEVTVTTRVTNDGGEIILPDYVDQVLSVRVDSNFGSISPTEPSVYWSVDPAIFERTGIATSFSPLTSVGVKFLPPTQEKLLFQSTSNSDTGNIQVKGELNGSEVSETVTLTGTTPVSTKNKYDTPITVAKDITLGNVSVNGVTSGALLQTLLANQREKRHIRIWVQPVPSATECLILGKRKIAPLSSDQDTPIIRNCQHVLIPAVAAQVLRKDGKDSKEYQMEADQAYQELVNLYINQAAYSSMVVPDTGGCYGDLTLTKAGWR